MAAACFAAAMALAASDLAMAAARFAADLAARFAAAVALAASDLAMAAARFAAALAMAASDLGLAEASLALSSLRGQSGALCSGLAQRVQ